MRKLLLTALMLGALVVPASAMAAPHHPKGEFAQFSDCPLNNAKTFVCVFSESTKGSFTIGKKVVPLVNPVILQGGAEINPKTFETPFLGAEDGNTLSKTPQPVPGGLLGIEAPSWWPTILKNLFNETINNGFTGVTATVELAAPATSIKLDQIALASEEGVALSLPSKIKLSNPFLGSSCYIGSNSSPITFNFTTGKTSPPPPTKSISGALGSVTESPGGVITVSGGRLVDNAFGAPGANGCGGIFSFLVDPLVESIVGVPSPAGTNTAILEGKLQIAAASSVRASE